MADSAPAQTPFQCPSCGFTIFNRRYPKCERCGTPIPDVFKYTAEQAREMTEHSLVTDFARLSEQIQSIEAAIGPRYLRVNLRGSDLASLRQLSAESALSLSRLEQMCIAQENEVLRGLSPAPSGNAVCTGCQRPIVNRRHERCEMCGLPLPPEGCLTPEQRATLDDLDQKKQAIRAFRYRLDAAIDNIRQRERDEFKHRHWLQPW